MSPLKLLTVSVLLVWAPRGARAAELHPDTLRAWDEYLRRAGTRMQEGLASRLPFFWTDEAANRRERLHNGEILVWPGVRHGTLSVQGGLIHHWVGAIFIPGGTIGGLWRVVHDYDHYQEIYKPAVTESSVIACTDSDQEFSMVWERRVLFVDAAIQAEYRAHVDLIDARRGYALAEITRVQEIENYGPPHAASPAAGPWYRFHMAAPQHRSLRGA